MIDLQFKLKFFKYVWKLITNCAKYLSSFSMGLLHVDLFPILFFCFFFVRIKVNKILIRHFWEDTRTNQSTIIPKRLFFYIHYNLRKIQSSPRSPNNTRKKRANQYHTGGRGEAPHFIHLIIHRSIVKPSPTLQRYVGKPIKDQGKNQQHPNITVV